MTTTVWLVRHGETRSYSSDSGLTRRGVEQAHRRGVALADAVGTGTPVTEEPLPGGVGSSDRRRVRVLTARSNRARETAKQLRQGLLDRLPARLGEVPELEAWAEFDNFAVATPQGRREITDAHDEHARARERHGRAGTGPLPGWVVEIDRFWAAQDDGGDPIRFWLTVPLLHFEPPSRCVRRFWLGVRRLLAQGPPAHLVVATHSGPMRAFATAALGHDLGEPHNAEVVTVRIDASGELASVTYRDRSHEMWIPHVEPPAPWSAPA
jgi:broad specificity phosphatase PhoE